MTFVLVFMSYDSELARNVSCDSQKIFSSDLIVGVLYCDRCLHLITVSRLFAAPA